MLARMIQRGGRGGHRLSGRRAIDLARNGLRDRRYPLPKVQRAPVQLTAPTVYFCAPDFDVPSGGVRVIYRHVDLLNAAGIPACVLHRRPGFRCTWFANDTRVGSSEETLVGPDDLVVIGELAMPLLRDREPGNRFVVFNQNPHLTWQRVPETLVAEYTSSPDLAAIVVVSQHSLQMVRYAAPAANVVRVHNSIDPRLFSPAEIPSEKVVSYMPRGGRDEVAQVMSMLRARGMLAGWEVVPLRGMTEGEVAATLRRTTIFLSFAYHEGFGLPGGRGDGMRRLRGRVPWVCRAGVLPARVHDPVSPGDVLALAARGGRCGGAGGAGAGLVSRAGRSRRAIHRAEYSPQRERSDVVGLYRGAAGGGAA